MIGIYKITNPLGEVYIGASRNIERRIYEYKHLCCRGQRKVLASLLKFGVVNHQFEIVELCNQQELSVRENHYALFFNVLERGLNDVVPNENGDGLLFSTESIKNRSLAQKGKLASCETRAKQSVAQLGRKHSTKTKNAMRDNNKNLKYILNLMTGIFYHGTNDAAKSANINRHTLKNKLNGSKPNNTAFIYV